MEGHALVVQDKKSVFAQIPFEAIENVTYGYSKNHRWEEGSQVMIFPVPNPISVIIGGLVMLSKEKKHWLYVDYNDPAGVSTELVLRLDKSEYQRVLAAVKAQTGKDVEMLPEEGKEETNEK